MVLKFREKTIAHLEKATKKAGGKLGLSDDQAKLVDDLKVPFFMICFLIPFQL